MNYLIKQMGIIMSIFNKISRRFQKLVRFERLNSSNNFDFDEGLKKIKPLKNFALFKKAIDEHQELKEVLWIALYHCLYTLDVENEYLTVLNKNFKLIGDLIKGNDRSVEIPNAVKEEIINDNVLATFHNHFKGAILPSSNDLKNTVIPFIKFMVITSNGNIGIVVNDFVDFEDNSFELFKQEWVMYESYLSWSFNSNKSQEIQQIYDSDISENEKEKEEQILFDYYVGENLERFIDEFNSMMEKYNVYLIQIIIKERLYE